MGDISYKHLIESMLWSHSRVKAFEDCPYCWYLKYIYYPAESPEISKELFFASYGSFIHNLLKDYYKGEVSAFNIRTSYLTDFATGVKGFAPSKAIYENYFLDGFRYLSSLRPSENEVLSVEDKAEFVVSSTPFVGYIDLVERDCDGNIIITDHKSKDMKPRSKRKKPTLTDAELDSYLRQLYLYSHYIKEKYGQFPSVLRFNCFRKGVVIEQQFNMEAYKEAIAWHLQKIDEISAEQDFRPDIEFWKCRHLCECQDVCEYYQLSKAK